MKTTFICPKCKGYLNVGNNVIFTIKNPKHPYGIILLSPTLGDYNYIINPSYKVDSGEEYDFFCPMCRKSLSVSGIDNLVKVIMIGEDQKEHFVVFSRRAGEQCTYKITDDAIENYGADSKKYVDFLAASFMK